ncbi:YqjF family protein [Alkalihalobacillus sp. R86527]|uniref:YqjF family protein n=1 Tax=Alkalihalobacillus sp. R86527 TaxID=3093863 RepID=UPI00366C54C2
MNNRKGWIMKQTWRDLLFLHWPVDRSWLKNLLPKELEVDPFDGEAWIGIVPFEMSGIRFRGFPSVPFASNLLELNVRTYVKYGNKRGVYFFSLDASHDLGVWMARSIFHLPYYRATQSKSEQNGEFHFRSIRTHRGAKQSHFQIRYKPIGAPYETIRENLDFWLTERECLFVVHKGKVYQGDIKHERWPIQKATFNIVEDTLSDGYFFTKEKAIAHFSSSVTTHLWPFKRVSEP